MKSTVLILLLFALSSSCSGDYRIIQASNDTEKTGDPKQAVVVFSLDGIGFEQLKQFDPKFIEQYEVSSLRPNSNTLTFPGHATLATGVPPEEHRVLKNVPTAEELPFMIEHSNQAAKAYENFSNRLKVAPIWLLAKKANKEVHIHHWSMARHNWCGQKIRDNEEKDFDLKEVSVAKTASAVTAKLMTWDRQKDLLVYAYSLGLDKEGHTLGPFDPKVRTQWRNIKQSVVSMIDTLTTVSTEMNLPLKMYFVSDHGMFPIMASSAFDLTELLKSIGIPNNRPLRRQGKMAFTISGQQYSDEQLNIMKKYFKIMQRPNGDITFVAPERKMAQVYRKDLSRYCKKQSTELPHLWGDCEGIVASGHHDDKDPEAIKELIDGIYFSVVPNGTKPEAPIMQTDFVPIIAKDLGLDMRTQKDFGSCNVQPLENQ